MLPGHRHGPRLMFTQAAGGSLESWNSRATEDAELTVRQLWLGNLFLVLLLLIIKQIHQLVTLEKANGPKVGVVGVG